MPLEALILDYGNVLSHSQREDWFEAMAAQVGAPLNAFRDAYWQHRPPLNPSPSTIQLLAELQLTVLLVGAYGRVMARRRTRPRPADDRAQRRAGRTAALTVPPV